MSEVSCIRQMHCLSLLLMHLSIDLKCGYLFLSVILFLSSPMLFTALLIAAISDCVLKFSWLFVWFVALFGLLRKFFAIKLFFFCWSAQSLVLHLYNSQCSSRFVV